MDENIFKKLFVENTFDSQDHQAFRLQPFQVKWEDEAAGCNPADWDKAYPKLSREVIESKLRDVLYGYPENRGFSFIARDNEDNEITLEELYQLRTRGVGRAFTFGNLITGVGGAIEILESTQKGMAEIAAEKRESEIWYGKYKAKSEVEEEENKRAFQELKQKAYDKDQFECIGTKQKKIRRFGNNRKRTKARKKHKH